MNNLFDLLKDDETDFTIKFNNNDDISLNVNCEKELEDDSYLRYYFYATAENKQGQELGRISFNIENDEYVFFGVLLVDDKYGRKGVGSKLVEFMEYVAQQRGVSSIGGDFDPKDERAGMFYHKKGYKIIHIDDYDLVQKFIDIGKVNENISVDILPKEKQLSK